MCLLGHLYQVPGSNAIEDGTKSLYLSHPILYHIGNKETILYGKGNISCKYLVIVGDERRAKHLHLIPLQNGE